MELNNAKGMYCCVSTGGGKKDTRTCYIVIRTRQDNRACSSWLRDVFSVRYALRDSSAVAMYIGVTHVKIYQTRQEMSAA